jgi:UDP-N-acetylglucosamine 2-epimerase (non-hydrolysing)
MLLISFGTRPEYIKVKPLMDEMTKRNVKFKTFFTGQHKDLVKSEANFCTEIMKGDNRLDSIVSSIMNSVDFTKEKITSVLVQGDTTSAMAVALSAFQAKIPVVHLEAGLRTYNLKQPYPEEANRQIISRIASVHLCPTELSKQNLINEKVAGKIEVVGNTVLDNLKNVQTTKEKKVLVTMHRRENYGDIEGWFVEVNKLAEKHSDYEFVLPIHPNPEIKKHKHILKKINVVEHFEHSKLIEYLSSCSYVITDSGGIQEESAFLRKPCLVCRRETERTEGLNNFSLLCKNPEELFDTFKKLDSLKMAGKCPYGDGNSVDKIIKILQKVKN